MRILHTADWHLGRSLCGRSFHDEQEWFFLGPFLDLVRDARPDLLVIAGDIYDRAVPPGDSVALLGEILHRLVRDLGVQVVLIAGNHDDQRRLAFAAPLLRDAGLFIADSPVGAAITFADAHGPVHVLAADYGHPALIAQLRGDGEGTIDHEAAFAGVMLDMKGRFPRGERSIVVAHAFVQGGLTSDSERLLSVGASGAVSAAHLDGFDYVALGHLHRPQSLAGGRIRYSGSPLPYSFSEAGQVKSMALVELDAAGPARVREISLPIRSPLRIVRGTLDEMLELLPSMPDDWLQVVLTDRPFDAIARLRECHPMVLDLRFDAPSAGGVGWTPAVRAGSGDPLDALAAFWRAVRSDPLAPEALPDLRAAIQAAIDEDA